MEHITSKKEQQKSQKTSKLNSNSELIKRKKIKNTPFVIITINEKSFGTLGKYRITETYKTTKKCEEILQKITWNRITQIMLLLIEEMDNKKLNTIK